MQEGIYCLLFGILGIIFGVSITLLCVSCKKDTKENEPIVIGAMTERILKRNNILLQISLWKMIVGFAPKDEKGRYYTGVNGFVSDAFCRLGIENHTVDEQIALDKIADLDKELGEL